MKIIATQPLSTIIKLEDAAGFGQLFWNLRHWNRHVARVGGCLSAILVDLGWEAYDMDPLLPLPIPVKTYGRMFYTDHDQDWFAEPLPRDPILPLLNNSTPGIAEAALTASGSLFGTAAPGQIIPGALGGGGLLTNIGGVWAVAPSEARTQAVHVYVRGQVALVET